MLGTATGIGDPTTGHFALVIWSAVPIALVAGIASRTWLGVVSMVAGFGLAGAVAGILDGLATGGDLLTDAVQTALIVALSMGVVGIPVYLATVGVIRLVVRARRTGTDPLVDPPVAIATDP